MYHSQQHRMQNCQFLYLRESFGYNRELFVCPSCVHRVAIGRLRVCVGSILAFYQIREENRAKLKISYSCGHRVSKSARYDATLKVFRPGLIHTCYFCFSHMSCIMRKLDFCLCENRGADQRCSNCTADQRLSFRHTDSTLLKCKISSF